MTVQQSVTYWLSQWRDGDTQALEHVTEAVYQELRRLAVHYLDGEKSGHTLQPTDLVHEAYLHISGIREFDWKARGQFVGVLAQMMRRILIDHARGRDAAKRQPDAVWEERQKLLSAGIIDVLVVDQSLTRLAVRFPRQAKVVELRFFGGLESAEAAQVLEISLATVERDWRFAKAWLQKEFQKPS